MTEAMTGSAAKNSVKYIQFCEPNSAKNTVQTTMTNKMPKAYSECSMLMSRCGLSEGSAAMVGESMTSESPEAIEKTIVPTKSPAYAYCGKNVGTSA